MATDDNRNANPSGPGTSKQTPIGQSKASSNDWLGIPKNVELGSQGSRNTPASKYGGDRKEGVLFKGDSAGSPQKDLVQLNAGGSGKPGAPEKMSKGTGQYDGKGDSKDWTKGGFGSREGMTIGGDKNKGNLVGAGVKAIPDTNPDNQYKKGVPTQPGQDVIAGTDEAKRRNMPKAFKGIGPTAGGKEKR